MPACGPDDVLVARASLGAAGVAVDPVTHRVFYTIATEYGKSTGGGVFYLDGTNLAASGSLIFHGECQMRYIMGCIKALLERRARAMEVRREVHDDYNSRLDETLARTVWSHPAVAHSWYRNSKGRVTVLSPWKLLDYWTWTREPKLDEYEFRP